jgi:hypothetical protein
MKVTCEYTGEKGKLTWVETTPTGEGGAVLSLSLLFLSLSFSHSLAICLSTSRRRRNTEPQTGVYWFSLKFFAAGVSPLRFFVQGREDIKELCVDIHVQPGTGSSRMLAPSIG